MKGNLNSRIGTDTQKGLKCRGPFEKSKLTGIATKFCVANELKISNFLATVAAFVAQARHANSFIFN